ncbi:MAG: hypothetical protein HXY23_07405 [Parvularculaceae bacterium]|jgi:hypothetical protein|nr:hypothetical protein [Parvularculaceae bacterium]
MTTKQIVKAFLSTAAVVLGATPAAAENIGAAFEILRKGEPIGTHVVEVRQEGPQTVVDTNIKMRVKFGPVPLFAYDHESREVWRNGSLETIDSETNNNGRKSFLKVRRNGDTLEVDGSAYQGPAPLDAIPSSYWNRSIIEARKLLNTQNGEVIDISTTRLGFTEAPGGEPAEHFRLVGSVALDLWYDGPRWVGSTFTVRGEELTYRLIDDRSKLLATVEASLPASPAR